MSAPLRGMSADDTELPYSYFEFVRFVRVLRLSAKAKDVLKELAPYADADGYKAHPGVARLAVGLNRDCKYVQEGLKIAREYGLIQVTASGRGRSSRTADEYRLRMPVALFEAGLVMAPDEFEDAIGQKQEMRRPKSDRRTALEPVTAPESETPEPVDNPGLGGPDGSQSEDRPSVDETGLGGRHGLLSPPLEPVSVLIGGPWRATTSPPTYPLQSRPETTVVEERTYGSVVGDFTARPISYKCEHGLSTHVDITGIPKCPMCRRGIRVVMQLPVAAPSQPRTREAV